MEVIGGEISLIFSGRTRDSRFDLISSRSDLVTTLFEYRLHQLETGRGSPPKLVPHLHSYGKKEQSQKSKMPLVSWFDELIRQNAK